MKNNSTIEKMADKRVARPLKVLIPMIQRDITNAENAGKLFKIAAGAKLTEAKDQIKHGEWGEWIESNFHLSIHTAQIWMGWAKAEKDGAVAFETAEDFIRSKQGPRPPRLKRDYHTPIDRILSGISAKEMSERAATAAREHILERNLSLKLIGIGYKVLSIKLHPDKGGSHDAMRRLNKVRARLKEVYS